MDQVGRLVGHREKIQRHGVSLLEIGETENIGRTVREQKISSILELFHVKPMEHLGRWVLKADHKYRAET